MIKRDYATVDNMKIGNAFQRIAEPYSGAALQAGIVSKIGEGV